MRIHQITHLFSPDELAGASLYTDLARYLRDQGHEVRVTCTFSYYPALEYSAADRGVIYRGEEFEEMPMRRLGMYLPKRHAGWRRLLPEISYLWRLTRHAEWKNWKPDVVVAACPMLSQCAAQRLLYRGRAIPRLIIVQDFMVDAALELGILRNRGLCMILKRFERWALRSGSKICTISPQMASKLSGVGRSTEVIPNWIHRSLAENAERIRRGDVSRGVGSLFYSGNLGVKQGIPDFLSMFGQCADGWTFELYGAGAEAESVSEAVSRSSKVSLCGVLGESEYIERMSRSSACVITQRAGAGANYLPSKLLPALATGTPVLAVCDETSPLGCEVRAGGFGEVVRPGDVRGLSRVLDLWLREPERLEAFARGALRHAGNFSRARILGRYESELRSLVADKGTPVQRACAVGELGESSNKASLGV